MGEKEPKLKMFRGFSLVQFHLWNRVPEKQVSIIRKAQKQCVYFNIFLCQKNLSWYQDHLA